MSDEHRLVPLATYATNVRAPLLPAIMKSMQPPVPVKKASKPPDPAFKWALRVKPMQIGLRYIGD